MGAPEATRVASPPHPVARSGADAATRVDNKLNVPTVVNVVYDKPYADDGAEALLLVADDGAKAPIRKKASDSADVAGDDRHGFVVFQPVKERKTYTLVQQRGKSRYPVFTHVPASQLLGEEVLLDVTDFPQYAASPNGHRPPKADDPDLNARKYPEYAHAKDYPRFAQLEVEEPYVEPEPSP